MPSAKPSGKLHMHGLCMHGRMFMQRHPERLLQLCWTASLPARCRL